MAFFSGLSSIIGKKLLLFGLRHIDVLDKDPGEFVNVDVGKTTTLEVRDVGLHVKVSASMSPPRYLCSNAFQKLVALLHLKLPPEFHLSKARASRFSVSFVLELGVPHIIVEIEGIQIHARLAENEKVGSKLTKPNTAPRATSPARPGRLSSSPAANVPIASGHSSRTHLVAT